ncbi:DUF6923 family protein [Sulfitobacter pontiacus]|uniref:DUF6923 family protein n=1 Tax=Sulfitobacter pontiacus TaxID=60137 RepID=UPI0036DE34DA
MYKVFGTPQQEVRLMSISKLTFTKLNCAAALAALVVTGAGQADAGEFELDWGTYDWPGGNLGPLTRTLRDQYGFEVDLTFEHTGNYTAFSGEGTPNDSAIFGGNVESLVVISDAPRNRGRFGDARTTSSISTSSGGVAFPIDNLQIDILDIDASDSNAGSDRCDFVTAFGDNGNPTLAPVSAAPAVLVGPGPGSGFTGTIGANQAQCIYVEGFGASPTSNNDDTGTVRATFPDSTSTVTFWYDETIGNVRNYSQFTNYDPAPRGIGMFGAATFNVDQSISLTRTASPSTGTQGETVTYTYTVTNTGALPFNTGQDIVIDDDLLGPVLCPAITTPVAPGGTVVCQEDYTIQAADVLTGSVDSNAVAGIGRIGQPFVSRLQSNSESLSIVSSVLSGETGSQSCTPQSVFRQPSTQLAGSGSRTNVTPSDIFLFDDVTTDINGNPIDVVMQVTSINNATALELDTSLEARMTPEDDAYITYRLRLVQDGTATAANPQGLAIDQSRINGVIVQQTDVDSRGEGDDSSDVVGSLTNPTVTYFFNTAPLSSFPAGPNAIAMDPAKVGDPFDWEDEPNESSFDNYATYEFNTFVEAEFIHGYTGTSDRSATRGSGIQLCAISNTSPDIVAQDDDYTASPVNTLLGGTAGEVMSNDTINGLPAAFPTATLTVLTEAVPQNTGDPVPILETAGAEAGRVIVPAGVPAGVYTIEYQLCDALDPADCDRALVTVAVFAGLGVDFGDAPLSYLTPTHGVDGSPGVYLGLIEPDIELVAQSDATATADDLIGTDDEDGITFPVLTQGTISTLDVTVTGNGNLQAWIDFNGDGLFEETLGERIALDLKDDGTQFDNVAGDGVIQIDVTVPSDATTSTTYARFRYGSETGLSTSDFAVDGEVEDYSLVIAAADLSDRGDAPATYGDPRHIVVQDIYLGAGEPDTEQTPQHSPDSDADDLSGFDDEDSIAVFPILEAGTTVPLTIVTHETLSAQLALGIPVTAGITNLQLWVDFDQSGTFDPSEHIAVDYRDGGAGDTDGVFNNQITLNIPVPANISSGFTHARIRWSTSSAVAADPFDGLNFDGEVEDYKVILSAGAVPFTCDGSLYRVTQTDTQLQRLSFTESAGVYSITATDIGAPAGVQYDGGWGYNALDGLFYGVRAATRELIRLDSTGNYEVVSTLPASAAVGSTAGDILPNGVMVYRVNGANALQLLDLSDPSAPVDLGLITLSAAVEPSDIAYNPNDGMLYGVNEASDRLFYIDPADGTSGTRAPVEFGPTAWTGSYGAVWFDFYGRMYINQNATNEVYEADVGLQGSGSGGGQLINTVPVGEGGLNDGAACPSRFGPLPPEGDLSGVVYRDTNYSDSYQPGETVLSAVTVSLYDDNGTADTADDTFLTSVETASNGTYLFSDLSATATYRVEVDAADPDMPPGLVAGTVNPQTGVSITAGSVRTLDFGFVNGGATADLSLTKGVFDTSGQPVTQAGPGTELDFVLTVTNDGPDGTTGVRVRDLIPDGFTFVSATPADSTDTYDANTGTWDVGEVANGASETLTVRVTMNATGEHTNVAEIIASDLPDPDSDPLVGPLTDDLGDGVADDDEAAVSVSFAGSGPSLSGKVFIDNGAGSDTAYDALQGASEADTGAAEVRITDSSGTLIGSPQVASDGSWSLTLPEGFADDVTITVVPDNGLLTVSENPGALPGLVNPASGDGTFTFTPAAGTSYPDLDVGLIEDARLSESQQSAIRPAQVVTLRHEYLADAEGSVVFDTDIQSITAPGLFSVALFEDAACDGTATSPITTALPVTPDTRICLVARVAASGAAAPGSTIAFDVVADTTYGATGATEQDRNTDLVRVESSEGVLKLRKTVRNVTQGTPEGVSNGAAAGDVLEYRIFLDNPGELPATNIVIHDRTPPYTELASAIPSPVSIGGNVVCTMTTPGADTAGYAGALQWDCTGSHEPGATGSVSFEVRIAP